MLATAPPAALVYAFFAVILAWYAKAVWNRIPYAAANLRSAIAATRANLGLTLVAFSAIPFSIAWFALWFFALMGTMQTDFMKNQVVEVNVSNQYGSQDEETISALGGFVIVFFLLSFYWTHQVIKNTILTTIAGVIGTWWFAPEQASSFCSQAIKDSLLRSTTYSFGSICFGSLIMAIIQVMRDSLRNARNNRRGRILVCITACILEWIEWLAEFFNKWAFIYVGLYGYGYIEAGKNVMSLFAARGWSAIISDNLVNRLLGIVSLCIGLIVSFIAALVGFMTEAAEGWVAVGALIGLLIGVILSGIMMSVLRSSVDAIIVCYAEAPVEFRENHPELHAEMDTAWTEAWPSMTFVPFPTSVAQGSSLPEIA